MNIFKSLIAIVALAAITTGCSTPSASTTEPATGDAAAEPTRVGAVLDQTGQAAMTPADVLADLKEGNRRFVEDRLTSRDYLAQAKTTAADGQFPKAIVLSCLDSRVPPEIVFDQGIGDIFVGRIAGNFENTDMLGSMEFGAKLAGSKVIVVLGHTACGAVKGAADGAELGNLTAMLDNFDGALAAAREQVEGDYNSSNSAYVQAAIEENVRATIADIHESSPVLKEMVDAGGLMVVGGVYDLATGAVSWMEG